MIKILCEEIKKKNFDKVPIDEIKHMVGYIEPPESKKDTWDVNMSDGCIFACKTQETAQLMATLEEVKALLLKGNKNAGLV